MIYLRFLYISLLFLGSVSFSQDFLPSFADVPVSPEIIIDSDSAVSFEDVDGRIAEIRGVHLSSVSDLVAYYRGILPSLGWDEKVISGRTLHFIRDDEALWIDFIGDDEVLFRLSPSV